MKYICNKCILKTDPNAEKKIHYSAEKKPCRYCGAKTNFWEE